MKTKITALAILVFALVGCTLQPFLNPAVPGDHKISLNWTDSGDVNYYRIRYGTVSGQYTQQINLEKQTSYTIAGLTNGQRYYFVVDVVFPPRGEVMTSNEVSGVPTTSPIASPVMGSPNPGNEQVTLNWSSVSGALGYYVRFGIASGSYGTAIDVGNVTSYTVLRLANDYPYYFVVMAYDQNGASQNSNEVTAIPMAPVNTVTITLLVPGDGTVTVSWSSTGPVSYYRLKVGPQSGNLPWVTDPLTSTSFTVTGLTNGTTYFGGSSNTQYLS